MKPLNPWQFAVDLVMGILLGWWYVKTNSIAICIFGYGLYNGMSFMVDALGLSKPGYNVASNITWHQLLWLDSLGIVLFVSGVVWLVKLFNKSRIGQEQNVKIADGNV